MLWLIGSCQNKVSADQDLELKLTADRVLVFDWIASSSQVITLGEEEGVRAKENFVHINPWLVDNFSSDIFLAQSSLGKSLVY